MKKFGHAAGRCRAGESDPVKCTRVDAFKDFGCKCRNIAAFIDDKLFQADSAAVQQFREYITTATGAGPRASGLSRCGGK